MAREWKARADAFLTRHFTRPSITWRQASVILLPLVAETLFTNLFSLLNTAMVSSSGVTSLSAVSLVDTLNSFLFVFYLGVSTGASVVVANYRGRRDEKKLHDASVQAVSLVTAFTLGTTAVILLFHGPLLRLLFGQAEAEVMDKARMYMVGNALTLPVLGVTTSTCAVLRGIGEGKTSLSFTLVSTTKYVLFNVLFLRILNLGIPGLILAISLSRALDLAVLIFLLRRTHTRFVFRFRELLRLHRDIAAAIMAVGVPVFIEQLFFTGGRVATQALLVPMGTNATAAYNISYSLMSFSQILVNSVSASMYTIMGICVGARREKDVRELTRSYFLLCTGLYVLSIGVMYLYFGGLIRFYSAPEEIVPLIFLCAMSTTVAQPFIHNFAFLLPNVLRAAGDGTFCTVASLTVMWVCRVGGGWLLGTKLGMGVQGIWLAMLIDWVARAVLFPLRFRGSGWLRHQLLGDAPRAS